MYVWVRSFRRFLIPTRTRLVFLTIPLMSVGVQGKMIQDHAKRNSLTTINSTIQMNLNRLSREPIDR